MTNPAVLTVEEYAPDRLDEFWLGRNRTESAKAIDGIPRRFADSVVTEPVVRDWVATLIRGAVDSSQTVPTVLHGPSLCLLGPTGTGKTYQAWGALRALAASGVQCKAMAATAADVYAKMRPRHGVDSEAVFESYATAGVLVFDDLGAEKPSEWTEEVNYRLINYRYEHERPTLFTSNLAPAQLSGVLGDRVTSRMVGMSTSVAMKGQDRRRNGQ